MRKSLLVVWCMLVSMMCANATVQFMTVELKNGEKFSFLLDDNPVVTYSNGNLEVNGSAATSYALSGVKNYHFTEGDQTAVVNSGVDVLQFVGVDDNTIRVENVPAGLRVVLYNANGMNLAAAVADQSGRVAIALPNRKGVYVLAVGEKSVKVIRK